MVRTLRELAFWALMTFAAMLGMTVGVLLVKVSAGPPALRDLLPYQMPGQPVPHSADCSWESYQWSGRYCQEGDVFYALDVHGRIEHSSVSVHDLTVGDYILAWGTPDGYAANSWSHSIMWGNRTLYVWGRDPFSPTSRAAFLSYGLKPDLSAPWQGFINKETRQ